MKAVAVIPARGGSKGIPRKNLRPIAGKPMIYWSITACRSSRLVDEVYVTTDDDEIALFAERFGARVIIRDPAFANDAATLDPVIVNAFEEIRKRGESEPDVVITVQPTSPLIKPRDLDEAVRRFREKPDTDTVLSVVDDRHLCWTIKNGRPVPLYEERVNRQKLPANFRETGAVIACRAAQLATGTRIGDTIDLMEMPQSRSFDIDNFSDLYLCESILQRKKIALAVIGYPEVGLGHVYRSLMLANELVSYDLTFVCERRSALAADHISAYHYDVVMVDDGALVDEISAIGPDLVINDVLDTDEGYVTKLRESGAKVINFEDLGSGSKAADLVINALYQPSEGDDENVCTGSDYFCLRDEFIFLRPHRQRSQVENILLTFGGVDEGNLTLRVAEILHKYCLDRDITLTIVLGPGYGHHEVLSIFSQRIGGGLKVVPGTARISDYMLDADVAITSGGRTVFELASLAVPVVVICQNERELAHTFASEENGITNLGHRELVTDDRILEAVSELVENNALRRHKTEIMKSLKLSEGKGRVCKLIKGLLEEGE